jgi:outer membrane protein assembly factor BamB
MNSNMDKQQISRVSKQIACYGIIICIVGLLFCFGCKSSKKKEVDERKNISNFTLYKNHLYFGAGYKLCRIDLSTKSLETLYSTNTIRVEQPVIDDNVVYFGGSGLYNENGACGDRDCFFALDVQRKEILWRFPLDPHGYGTFGTYPSLADNNVLVCARKHLYCINRASGKLLWQIDNWFGSVGSDEVEIPYLYKDHIYYKLKALERDPNDDSWAVVSIGDGKRIAILPLLKEKQGQGLGTVDNGILYLTARYGNSVPRNGYVGAIDLANKKMLWEAGGYFSRSRPSVNEYFVYTSRWNSVVALFRNTGEVIWEKAIEEITVNPNLAFEFHFPRLASTRIVATDKIVFVRDGNGIIALNATSGELIWSKKHKTDFNTTYPIIVDGALIISNLTESSVIALDFKTGAELWKVKVPDCSVYMPSDDE